MLGVSELPMEVEEVEYARLPDEPPVAGDQARYLGKVETDARMLQRCVDDTGRLVQKYLADVRSGLGRPVRPRIRRYLRGLPRHAPVRVLLLGQSPYRDDLLPHFASAFAFATSETKYPPPSAQVLAQAFYYSLSPVERAPGVLKCLVTIVAKTYAFAPQGVWALNANPVVPLNDCEEVLMSSLTAGLLSGLVEIAHRASVGRVKVYAFGRVAYSTAVWARRSMPTGRAGMGRISLVQLTHPAALVRKYGSARAPVRSSGELPAEEGRPYDLDKRGQVRREEADARFCPDTTPWRTYTPRQVEEIASPKTLWLLLSDILGNKVTPASIQSAAMSAIFEGDSDGEEAQPPRPAKARTDKGKSKAGAEEKHVDAKAEGTGSYLQAVVEQVDGHAKELSRSLVAIRSAETKLAAAARTVSEGAFADLATTFQNAVVITGDCLDLVLRGSAFVASLRATLQGETPLVPGASGTVPGLVGRGVDSETKKEPKGKAKRRPKKRQAPSSAPSSSAAAPGPSRAQQKAGHPGKKADKVAEPPSPEPEKEQEEAQSEAPSETEGAEAQMARNSGSTRTEVATSVSPELGRLVGSQSKRDEKPSAPATPEAPRTPKRPTVTAVMHESGDEETTTPKAKKKSSPRTPQSGGSVSSKRSSAVKRKKAT